MTDQIDEFGEYLAHIGVARKSGRYPWGSGENPNQHSSKEFLDYVGDLRKQGLTETQIAEGVSMTTTQLRALKSIAKNEQRAADAAQVLRLKEKGMSNVAIGQQMGINESSVRALLDPAAQARNDQLTTMANKLRDEVAEKGYLDVGAGTQNHLGISGTKLNTAVAILEEEGYGIHYVKVQQLGTGKQTTIKVLAPPETPYSEVFKNQSQIKSIAAYSEDNGRTLLGIQPPIQVDPKRVAVRYKDEGGADADGVIYVRPGVEDVTLGGARYAQVRVAVGGTHYLKGMAMYNDDLPDGVDLMFNTNKERTANKLDAMKALKDDPDSPFGATVRQLPKLDANGKGIEGTVRSAMNIVNEEGKWDEWSKNLSSQMLSKQTPALAKQQLGETYARKKAEYDEIMALTNPAVKKRLLEDFSDGMDSSAVHLKAAAMPRQKTQVILPINSLKDTEIYAPQFRNGERVALVRYPHGGIFEIPELVVNNSHPQAKKALGSATDAVGINSKVAARLSGADFDGDTVLVIPNNTGAIRTSAPLAKLKGFDPQTAYPAYEGMKPMSARTKQLKMGDVSNLITDMTIKKATQDELARAVRHSMVVIDAEKHNLNWKQSAVDNGISELKTKYQRGPRSGADTLISKASSEIRVDERKLRSAANGGPIDKTTGKLMYEETGRSFVNKTGKVVALKTKTTRMAEAEDARTLSSGTPMEAIYADHANKLKALANASRKAGLEVKPTPISLSAKKVYENEVKTLNAKLNIALKNAPLERQAQLFANATLAAKKAANPDMEASEIKKIKGMALVEARNRVGADKIRVDITPKEWDAIQAGAISNNKLNQILSNADIEQVRKLATPRDAPIVNAATLTRAKSMLAAGHTQADIADHLGIPIGTLNSVFTREES